MQAIEKKIILVVLIAAVFAGLWRLKAPEQEEVSLAQTSLEAADELMSAHADGRDSLLFYSPDIDEKQVYHLLQAQNPYLSTLETASYRNGNLKLTYQVQGERGQKKGLEEERRAGDPQTAPVALARAYVEDGLSVNEAARQAAKETGAKKSDLYRALLESKK